MSLQGRLGCRSMRRALLDYADGEQSATDRFAFELHTEECAACRDAVGFHLKIEELLHRDAGIEADPGFEDRIVAGIRQRIAGQAGSVARPGETLPSDPNALDPLFGDADAGGDGTGLWFDELERAGELLRALRAEESRAEQSRTEEWRAEEARADEPQPAARLAFRRTAPRRVGLAVARWAAAAAILAAGSAVLYRALPTQDAPDPSSSVNAVKTSVKIAEATAPSPSATDVPTRHAVAAQAVPIDTDHSQVGTDPLIDTKPQESPAGAPTDFTTAQEFANLVPIGPSGDTQLLFDRLREVQRRVRDELVVACSAPDFRSSFSAGVAALESERWPIENLVLSAIDDVDPDAANAAIRGAAELKYQSALPAIRRATRRGPTAATAMISLGSLGDDSMLKTMARNLTSPALSRAAFTGLARLGSFEAACAIAEHLTDPELGPEAAEALADLGLTGIAELMRVAAEGNAFSRDVLRRRGLPTAAQVVTLLEAEVDPQVVTTAIRYAAVAGARAVPGLRARLSDPTFGDASLKALVSMVHPEAVAAIADAIERRDIDESVGLRAIRTSLELALDPGPLLAAATTEPGASLRLLDAVAYEVAARGARASSFGPAVVSAPTSIQASTQDSTRASTQDSAEDALATTTLADRVLPALLANAQVPTAMRAKAAIQLAGVGRLDAEVAVGQCALLWAIDPDSAAVFLIAACRSHISPALRERLQFLPRPTMKVALARADSIAERWGRTGPSESDIQRISRILQGAAPRI